MSNSAVKDNTSDLAEILQTELAGEFGDKSKRPAQVVSMASSDRMADPGTRLPRKIAGGFRGLGDDLDKRAREWRNMVRLLEQQRPHLEIAETERDRLYQSFARMVPEVQESGRQLALAMATARDGDLSGDLAAKFQRSLTALDELESLAEAMTANVLAIRSTWEQYARTVIRAQKMREELKSL